jgi:hypothetical protein
VIFHRDDWPPTGIDADVLMRDLMNFSDFNPVFLRKFSLLPHEQMKL